MILQRAQGVQLLHHETLNRELLDDDFLDAAFGRHVVNVEMYQQFILVLQVVDVSVGTHDDALVVVIDLDITEGYVVVVTLHVDTEVEGHGEVFQYGGKGARNVGKHGLTLDF